MPTLEDSGIFDPDCGAQSAFANLMSESKLGNGDIGNERVSGRDDKYVRTQSRSNAVQKLAARVEQRRRTLGRARIMSNIYEATIGFGKPNFDFASNDRGTYANVDFLLQK